MFFYEPHEMNEETVPQSPAPVPPQPISIETNNDCLSPIDINRHRLRHYRCPVSQIIHLDADEDDDDNNNNYNKNGSSHNNYELCTGGRKRSQHSQTVPRNSSSYRLPFYLFRVRHKDSNLLNFLIFLTVYIGFLVMGGLVFEWLERDPETAIRHRIQQRKVSFLRNYDTNKTLNISKLDLFINEILQVDSRIRNSNNGNGHFLHNQTKPVWSLSEATFFASTIVTTIGYGHITPLSQSGKLFCIGYACVGIPLTLIVFQAFVTRFLYVTDNCLQLLFDRFRYRFTCRQIRIAFFWAFTFLNMFVMLVIPAITFNAIEAQWTFLDSFYYCFISLTSIGLGDFVPAHSSDHVIYKILVTVYLYAGAIIMTTNLAIYYRTPELQFGHYFYLNGPVAASHSLPSPSQMSPLHTTTTTTITTKSTTTGQMKTITVTSVNSHRCNERKDSDRSTTSTSSSLSSSGFDPVGGIIEDDDTRSSSTMSASNQNTCTSTTGLISNAHSHKF